MQDLKIDSYLEFEISNYLRRSKDSLYKNWYQLTIDNLKAGKRHVNSDKTSNVELFYYIALSYYYLNDFKQANIYFPKSIKIKVKEAKCAHYFYSLSLKQLGQFEEAENEMKLFESYPSRN